MNSQDYLSVSELNNYIKDVIGAGFPQSVWVCGEIQQYNRNKGRTHVFFELVEKKKDSKDIKARIGLVIFAGVKSHIQQILKKSENAFELKDDIEVKFLCRVDFYAPHGALRLIVEAIDPSYTLGKLAQERQRIIALLTKNGTFEKNKKHLLPEVPLSIGLITAHDSAAYNDFLSEIHKSGFGFKIFVCDSLVQGKNAPKDIVAALNQMKKTPGLDLIVLTRGGGSLADLACFDDQKISETIGAMPLPVLTGIGHEINISIADMAAHTYAKTPTAIAQFLVNRVSEFMREMTESQRQLLQLATDMLETRKRRLREAARVIHQGTVQYLKDHNQQIAQMSAKLQVQPLNSLRRQTDVNKDVRNQLDRSIKTFFERNNQKLKQYEKMVAMVHPKNTLRRGFSITRDEQGKVFKQAADVQANQLITTELHDGSVTSRVE